MALKMTIQSNTGINIEDAYIHIDEYSCNKEEVINARIRSYISRDLMKNGANFISGSEEIITIQGDYSDTAMNTKKQIYNHIKTLDKYLSAIDILEEIQEYNVENLLIK